MKISKIYTNTVSPLLLDCFYKLSNIEVLKNCRLVGGTALSLILGHRMSVDIDLFTDQKYGSLDFSILEKELNKIFPYVNYSDIDIVSMGKTFYLGNNKEESIKVDIFYASPFIGKGISNDNGVMIASLNDIIPMKIQAVMNRGSKKDFWDLHEILEHYSFEEILDLYNTKFPYEEISNDEIYEKFLFFDNADLENNPECLKGKYWDFIKDDIKNYVDIFFKKQGLKL